MNTLKPPLRCPSCGALPAELTKRWERSRSASGRIIRYPISIGALYHCGARLEAQFIVRGISALASAGAEWRLVTIAGCREAMEELLPGFISRRTNRRRRDDLFTPGGLSTPSERFSHVQAR